MTGIVAEVGVLSGAQLFHSEQLPLSPGFSYNSLKKKIEKSIYLSLGHLLNLKNIYFLLYLYLHNIATLLYILIELKVKMIPLVCAPSTIETFCYPL